MAPQDQSVDTSNTDPPEVTVGERLFLETRFAQFFKAFLDNGGKTNSPLPVGDPVVDTTVTTGQPLPGPFAGQSMNCRACHLVDEQLATPGGGMRTYADFARRSPVPARSDGKTTTVRNSPAMVNATLPRPNGILLHFDAEFASLTDLIIGTYTGRNLGWLPTEAPAAIAHMARIIREDDGKGSLAKKYSSLPFSILLTGTDPSIPDELRIPESFRINVATATDQEIFEAVARLVAAYVESLVFSQDDAGNFNGSPFDVFLSVNGFPRRAGLQEAPIDFSRRLLQQVKAREQAGTLSFVNSNPQTPDGKFQFHNQPFVFGTTELQGLKIFFGEAPHCLQTLTFTIQGQLRPNMMRFTVQGLSWLSQSLTLPPGTHHQINISRLQLNIPMPKSNSDHFLQQAIRPSPTWVFGMSLQILISPHHRHIYERPCVQTFPSTAHRIPSFFLKPSPASKHLDYAILAIQLHTCTPVSLIPWSWS
jgi:hypothetical protein